MQFQQLFSIQCFLLMCAKHMTNYWNQIHLFLIRPMQYNDPNYGWVTMADCVHQHLR